MKEMKTLTLNGEQYQITDALAARINDQATGPDSTWSGERIADALNNMHQAAVAVAVEAVEPRLLDIGETDARQDEALQDLNDKVTGLIDDSSRATDKTLSAQYIHEMFSYTDQLHTNWLRSRVDDSTISENKTWSSQKLSGELTALQEKDAQQDGDISSLLSFANGVVNDNKVSGNNVWSSQKVSSELGDVESALDSILAMQNALIGGDST